MEVLGGEVERWRGGEVERWRGGEVDLELDGFEVTLEPEFTWVLVKVNGLRGAGALREPMDSNSSFPVTLTPGIVLATVETLRHMLDFRFSMSCLGLG